ncbi:MAG: M15 family metallopeptidase [Bacteroidia bacterium]
MTFSNIFLNTILVGSFFITISACQPIIRNNELYTTPKTDSLNSETIINKIEDSIAITSTITYTDIEEHLIKMGLVNIQEIDPGIKVDLRYSSTNNFMNADVYGDWENAYLQPDVAEKLVLAQMLLKSKFPNYSLLILDAARPVSVQYKMWKMLEMPSAEKTKYLSNPQNGSLHNYGAAVDVTIVNEMDEELDMGTPYDFFGEEAHPSKEMQLLLEGKLTEEQINNRKLLRDVMQKAGFTQLPTEWWHFNACSRPQAIQKYQLIP